ncbi:MAG: iron ABC transporter permease, partial [Rhodospirillaceae bacterium]|nr:iron ABC transporter permease [Rhodospirillaceae bacterium]
MTKPWRQSWGRLDLWAVGTVVFAVISAVPVMAVIYLALTPGDNIWPHLVSTVLGGYIATTITLMVGVGSGTLVLGVGSAWLVTMCRFPGRRLFEW